nr:LuxR C-terminal-related transcriptional regulator [Isoptericola halotolerans]
MPAGCFVETDLRLVLASAAARRGHDDVARRALAGAFRPGTTRLPWLFVPAEDRARLVSLAAHDPDLSQEIAALPDLPAIVPARTAVVQLTEREQVVLQGLAEGLGGPQLAARLHVTLHTIKSQTRTLYRKLGVRSRADALVVARRRGLL